jgi:hypothetical protein
MKKLMFVIMACVGLVSAQTIVDAGGYGDRIKYYAINAWTPFATDSMVVAYSDWFDISGADSVRFSNYSTSTNGSAKYYGVMMVSAAPTVGSDSTGVCADTTSVLLEKYKSNMAILPTYGATQARVKVKGNGYLATESATQNRCDTKIYMYITIYKGQRYLNK